ncbi:uncharacterized protein B0I36DRAFT_309639 [Microdochium trichocladiopsis]|uniref:CFEM domain-containing protein n=1 Tax=Microdochium trichocladiopsis TaxID=1682393 RepID=A0A9P8YJ23_9PEZI|nr:uncharacterized protein B0I36DRAFT_309639 [Microdochium trichocladiopsis]KAH7039939.1 hypothetical protein B0I36DRAFT_309639 [Microdochium trichocladiopsis]
MLDKNTEWGCAANDASCLCAYGTNDFLNGVEGCSNGYCPGLGQSPAEGIAFGQNFCAPP